MKKKIHINIKKENKGKFLKFCKKLGYEEVNCACIERGLVDKNKKIQKEARFAKNIPFKNKCK